MRNIGRREDIQPPRKLHYQFLFARHIHSHTYNKKQKKEEEKEKPKKKWLMHVGIEYFPIKCVIHHTSSTQFICR